MSRSRSSLTSSVRDSINCQYPAVLYSDPFSAPLRFSNSRTRESGISSSAFTAVSSFVTQTTAPGGQYPATRVLQTKLRASGRNAELMTASDATPAPSSRAWETRVSTSRRFAAYHSVSRGTVEEPSQSMRGICLRAPQDLGASLSWKSMCSCMKRAKNVLKYAFSLSGALPKHAFSGSFPFGFFGNPFSSGSRDDLTQSVPYFVAHFGSLNRFVSGTAAAPALAPRPDSSSTYGSKSPYFAPAELFAATT
mmetsp:Transcript_23056/g.57305  ORF Transcript_23056/g.57305 Transcript_23056/m.57305 type:complete len:251 (+) Transcript_23056:753-1505(+)